MATQTQVTAIDGDGHILENPKRLAELLEEPYREFRSTPMESSALVPLDGVDRNLGTRLFKGSGRTTQEWLDALDRGPMAKSVLFPTLGLFSGVPTTRGSPATSASRATVACWRSDCCPRTTRMQPRPNCGAPSR
jgi:hypothetical protein